ncbi:DNA internalization-related competence protein ComEC/Rec2 [Luteibacter sp.]|uniref:DNA internalization-related competence protein ComEC/Rec2 n=1 Tax=Luteibacter sp. TaxID=1886636 RepID=UPI0031B686F5
MQILPALPSRPMALVACALALASMFLWRHPAYRHGAWWVAFAAWTAFHGQRAMEARWPVDREGQDILVEGRVMDLPRRRGADVVFVFRPDTQQTSGLRLRGDIRVTWFRTKLVSPRACEHWRLTLRLRRPRGGVNPGGADSERSALQRNTIAVGYVRDSPGNARLATPTCVDGWRETLAERFDRAIGARDARMLKALAIGDTRGLDATDWDIARATGTSHLIAISGFHVGVAAGGGIVLARWLYLLFPLIASRVPRQLAEALAGLSVAGAYGVLAGLGLPTVRSLLMAFAIVLAGVARRRGRGFHLLALAALAMLAVDPLAMLSAGFWLSFAGVAFLMLCVSGGVGNWRSRVLVTLRAQAAMSIALLPLSLWFFGSASLVAFPANLVAAPVVSFVVVPLALLGCLLSPWPWLATVPWKLAALAMTGMTWPLAAMAQWPGARWAVADGGVLPVVLATLGAAWLFVPRGVPLRVYGCLLFLPLAMPRHSDPPPGGFRAWVLDVGQGLAVLVRTHGHTLVYDAGPAYPGGDAGQAVVLPSVTALGIAPVDALVVSHGDNDHAGGAAAVATRYPDAARWSGEPGRLPFAAQPCDPPRHWRWDGVDFRFVDTGVRDATKSNERSCVLLVEGAAGRLLLTGDIGVRSERQMARDDLRSPLPTVTTVAHHGSRHSSDTGWLATTRPVIAVASAGWRNRFGHPHPDVVARHEAVGVQWRVTASSGAVAIDFPADAPPSILREWRAPKDRYWRE